MKSLWMLELKVNIKMKVFQGSSSIIMVLCMAAALGTSIGKNTIFHEEFLDNFAKYNKHVQGNDQEIH